MDKRSTPLKSKACFLFYSKLSSLYLDMKFTAIIEKGENGWFVGQVEEIPAALSQGKTIQEVKDNLLDALKLILEVNKELTEKEYIDKSIVVEELELN